LVVFETKVSVASAEIWHKINLLKTFYLCHYFAEDIINFVSVMAKNYFKSYIWLLETLQSRGPLTLKQIQELWLKCSVNDERKPLAPRTFANHIASIADIFNIYIVCDRRNNTYSIDNESDIGSNDLRNWMLDALCINSLVKESTGLRDRIIFENVPSGHQFLTKLIQAIRDNRKVRITYKGYTMGQEMTYELEPYFIREFKRRWYLYAHKDYDKDHEPHMYALDRMSEIEVLAETFEIPKSIDAEEWFSSIYGVRKYSDMKRERVVLKVYGKQVQFFRSLPLHHSQEEIETQEEFSIFTYHLAPDYDFRQDILSFGDKVEVLKPEGLRSMIMKQIANLINIYM
jgi:hypothetical protein